MANDTKPAAEPDSLDQPIELVKTTAKILERLASAPDIDLRDPLTFLALQLLGPILAIAVGDDPERSSANLIGIARLVDVKQLRKYLQGVV